MPKASIAEAMVLAVYIYRQRTIRISNSPLHRLRNRDKHFGWSRIESFQPLPFVPLVGIGHNSGMPRRYPVTLLVAQCRLLHTFQV
jgi:hypothetical protein